MVSIYCIEDCDGLKYVGSTKNKLNERLSQHKTDKKRKNVSSSKLDLDNCKIYLLETCNESNRLERERYWINQSDTVNQRKFNYNNNQYTKEWYQNNKGKKKGYDKDYYLFRSKKVVNGCYQFIQMLEQY